MGRTNGNPLGKNFKEIPMQDVKDIIRMCIIESCIIKFYIIKLMQKVIYF